MKYRLLVVFVLAICLPGICAEKPKPFRTIDLNSTSADANGCAGKWSTRIERLVWIDSEHIAASLMHSCSVIEARVQKHFEQVAVIALDGSIRSTRKEWPSVLRGPAGTLIVSREKEVDLLDLELHVKQTIQCPKQNLPCGAFVPENPLANSDFALCSLATTEETCSFYRGAPSAEVPELARTFRISGIRENPYEQTMLPETIRASAYPDRGWKVGPTELWYFVRESAVLTSIRANGDTEAISRERWTPKGSYCSGEVSTAEPKRFLAVCNGARIFTDGDLDSIFGYSRIALFDVSTRAMIFRIDGPSYTTAELSPEGHFVGVARAGKLRLYRVN